MARKPMRPMGGVPKKTGTGTVKPSGTASRGKVGKPVGGQKNGQGYRN